MNYPAFKLSHLEEKEPHLYDGCGLEGIYLLNGYEVGEDEHGEWDSIQDMFGLHEAIVLYLARQERSLTGPEIAFCRKTLEMTQRELAELIRKDVQTVARWEKGQSEIPATECLVLRAVVIVQFGGDQGAAEMQAMIMRQDMEVRVASQDEWLAAA